MSAKRELSKRWDAADKGLQGKLENATDDMKDIWRLLQLNTSWADERRLVANWTTCFNARAAKKRET